MKFILSPSSFILSKAAPGEVTYVGGDGGVAGLAGGEPQERGDGGGLRVGGAGAGAGLAGAGAGRLDQRAPAGLPGAADRGRGGRECAAAGGGGLPLILPARAGGFDELSRLRAD